MRCIGATLAMGIFVFCVRADLGTLVLCTDAGLGTPLLCLGAVLSTRGRCIGAGLGTNVLRVGAGTVCLYIGATRLVICATVPPPDQVFVADDVFACDRVCLLLLLRILLL